VRVDGLYDKLVIQIAALREVIDTRLRAADHALGLQAAEIERRMSGLNHMQSQFNAERMRDIERYLPREIHEGFVKEVRTWREMVERRTAEGVGQYKGVGLVWAVLIGAVPTLIALAALWQRAQP